MSCVGCSFIEWPS